MEPLVEIGETLGQLYSDRARIDIEIWKLEKDIQARKLELTPAEGWQGKNAELREIEAQRVFSGDEILETLVCSLDELKNENHKVEAIILGMEAERRGFEWQIRAGLVEGLTGKEIQYEVPGDNVDYSAFEDVLDDSVLENGTEFMSGMAVPEQPVNDDLPF